MDKYCLYMLINSLFYPSPYCNLNLSFLLQSSYKVWGSKGQESFKSRHRLKKLEEQTKSKLNMTLPFHLVCLGPTLLFVLYYLLQWVEWQDFPNDISRFQESSFIFSLVVQDHWNFSLHMLLLCSLVR